MEHEQYLSAVINMNTMFFEPFDFFFILSDVLAFTIRATILTIAKIEQLESCINQ